MKKNYFLLLLMMVMMAVGGGKAWGQKTLYERGTTAWSTSDVGAGAWSNGTIGANGLEVTNGVASSITITPESDKSILTWTATWNPGNATGTANNTNAYISFGGVAFAFYGSSWFTKATIGSVVTQLSGVGTTRSRDYTISVTINQSTKEVSYSFTDNGKTVTGSGTITNTATSYTLTHALAGKSPGWINTATLKAVKIIEEENTAAYANYTVKYFCDGKEIKESVTRIGEVGTNPTLQISDTQTFYNSDNTIKYAYSSDDSNSQSIASDGSTVVSVMFSKIGSFNYSAVNNFGTTIASGSIFEGEAKTVCWPKYIQNNGKWYETTSPYGIVISEPTNQTVVYSESDITYCFEGNNLVLSRSYGNISDNVNYSNGDGYGVYDSANLTTTETVSAGTYVLKINTFVRRSNDDVLTIQTSSDGSEWTDYSSITLTNGVGGEFNTELSLEENSYIRFVNAGGNLCHYIDYVTLKEKVTAIPVTFSETNGVNVTISVDGETVSDERRFEVGDYSYTATADGYDDYEGSFTVTEDDVTAGSKTVSFTMLSADAVKSITVKYLFDGEEVYAEAQADVESLAKKVGDTYDVPFRAYVVKDGVLYQTAENGKPSPFYGESTVLTKETVVEKNVSVVDLKGGTLAFFVDLDNTTAQNAGIRASYCSAYDNKAFTSAETLEAGRYTFIIRKQNKNRGSSIAVGETTVYTIDGGNGAWGNVELNNIVVLEAGTLSLVAGGNRTYDDYDIIIAIRQKDTEAITITSAGAATYCSEKALNFEGSEVKAYYLTVDGDEINQSEVMVVPANTGIYLEGEAGTYEIPIASANDIADNTPEDNVLEGVIEETQVDAPIYVLMKESNGVGFYKTKNTFTVGAHTAYIPGSAVPTGVKALNINSSDDPTTAIRGISNDAAAGKDAVIYNLAGLRVAAPTKGIYIVNGKKVMVK